MLNHTIDAFLPSLHDQIARYSSALEGLKAIQSHTLQRDTQLIIKRRIANRSVQLLEALNELSSFEASPTRSLMCYQRKGGN